MSGSWSVTEGKAGCSVQKDSRVKVWREEMGSFRELRISEM